MFSCDLSMAFDRMRESFLSCQKGIVICLSLDVLFHLEIPEKITESFVSTIHVTVLNKYTQLLKHI